METLQKSRININEERAGNMSRSTGGGGNGKIRNISHGRSRDDGRKTGTSRDAKKGGDLEENTRRRPDANRRSWIEHVEA